VALNRDAFRLGRQIVAIPERVATALGDGVAAIATTPSVPDALQARVDALELDAVSASTVALLTGELVAYQDARYASTFLDTVEMAARAEKGVRDDSGAFAVAVAHGLYKLMAYKDEYEVARLLLDKEARRDVEGVSRGNGRVRYHLHPPVLRAMGMSRKMTFGRWFERVLRLLARAKRLRGTVFDPFRLTKVRRAERQLPGEYRAAIHRVIDELDAVNFEQAMTIAELPDLVRGYEDIKLRRVAEFRSRLADELARFTPPSRECAPRTQIPAR
jgi:indolepyruvate ferredoxin oxidoreductase